MKRALIAMSGGVDSSIAAFLIRQEGYELTGATMQLYEDNTITAGDIPSAIAIAGEMTIPHYVWNFEKDFRTHVIDNFVHAYESGYTPNPCIECNRYLKFDAMYQKMCQLGLDVLVTGHYARVTYDPHTDRYLLKKGIDLTKDQSYVLYHLTQEQLSHTRFPIGEYSKKQIRQIATENHLSIADKPESMDICFIPDGDYASFIERYTGKTYPPGDFISTNDHVLGQHRGILHYTIGQRRGLGVACGTPLYVCKIDPIHNTITLGGENELLADTLFANHVNWISGEPLTTPISVTAKIRYRHAPQSATVYPESNDTLRVVFDKPQRAITPGQAVVFYNDDIVLGGATILSSQPL